MSSPKGLLFLYMATNYPTALDTLVNPTASNTMQEVPHADQHANANDAIEALQTKVGIDSSADTNSLDYKVSNASSSNPGHVHTASAITDFDTEVANNTDVAANTLARHSALTVTDSTEIDFTLTGQDLTASIKAGSIDETKLDVSTNASLDLADSAVQPAAIANFETTTQLNARDTANRDRTNHTGTQTASTISDFQTAVSANSDVTANTAKVTNATHTGDVTGATALTIANDAVTNAKLANVATATIKGRVTASTGDPEDLTATQVRTLINVADGATANSSDATLLARANHTGTQTASTISDFQTTVSANSDVVANTAKVTNATHTGDVTGSTTLTIADNAVTEPKLAMNNTPTNGHVVAWNGTGSYMEWVAQTGGGGDVSTDAIWDAKGDLVVGTGNDTASRLAVGTNGQKLVAASGEATGLDWVDDFGSNSFVYNETPTGTVNGTNTSFTVASTPITGSLQLFRDGQLLKGGGDDYSISGTTITFTTAPVTDSVLLATYQVASTASANADTIDGYHASTIIQLIGGWNTFGLDGVTFTRASIDNPTVVLEADSDVTDYIWKGSRIVLTEGGTDHYMIVSADPVFGSGVTTITCLMEIDTATPTQALDPVDTGTITNVKYAPPKTYPKGFPIDNRSWAVKKTDSTIRNQSTPTQNTWYNLGSFSLVVPIGDWSIDYFVTLYVSKTSSADVEGQSTLSTSNNSESDAEYTAYTRLSTQTTTQRNTTQVYRNKKESLSSKETKYLNSRSLTSGAAQVQNQNDLSTAIIRATSTLL